MALNPFFLHGSSAEQNLIQDLINEQLKIYGIDVIYIPRKMLGTDNILREVQSSKFDDNFVIEAYVNTYEGYSGAGDIMTKFGVSLRDEITLTISKERFEEFIGPIMASIYNPLLVYNTEEEVLITRPREGDLIYFPLGERLFEIKFVEHEKPFYQLGRTYVYEVKCELFEYEDEIMDTSVAEVDELIKFVTTTMYLMDDDDAQRAVVVGSLTEVTEADSTIPETGYVKNIILIDDGYGYKDPPIVSISTSPAGTEGSNARAIAITTSIGGSNSILEILITNTGYGYTEAPTISFISNSGGAGAIASCVITTEPTRGLESLGILNPGIGYYTKPTVTVESPSVGQTAIVNAHIIDPVVGIVTFGIKDAGYGYATIPTISISQPEAILNSTGIGTFKFNEGIIGQTSGATAIVKDWDINSKELEISIKSGTFIIGETLIGEESGASWTLKRHDDFKTEDPFAQNDIIENEADLIVDFSELNPFGNY